MCAVEVCGEGAGAASKRWRKQGGAGGAQPQHICWHHLMQREPSRASLPAPSPPSVLRPWLRPLLQLAAENREQFPSPVPPRGLAGCPPAALRGEVPKSSPLLWEACGEPDPYPRHTETSRPCRSSEKCRARVENRCQAVQCLRTASGGNLAEPERAAACGLLGSRGETH